MPDVSQYDVHLDKAALKGRTFLLGNKRAFSLSLPAATGASSSMLHPHKWFGAYHYGRKFLEGHVVRTAKGDDMLSGRCQVGFTMGLTGARRQFEVNGTPCEEAYFVPDGVQGFACRLAGDLDFAVEPEFDIRFYRALNFYSSGYEVELITDGVVVSHLLPSGLYDDISETFRTDDSDAEAGRLYAAVQVVGGESWAEAMPERSRLRQKLFRNDAQRRRFLHSSVSGEASDHAPLWDQSTSTVYVPVRLHARGECTIIYGFGADREEALAQLDALRDNLVAFEAQKSDEAQKLMQHAYFNTGAAREDAAYAQVLSRLMDTLVARNAVATDTVLHGPATMILAGNQYFHDSWKRDENIALGFLLALGFYDLARDVVADTWQLQDEESGRLPQRIRAGEVPPYHSSDGTLWALWRLHGYWKCTGDELLLREKLPMVELFFRRSLTRAVDGMLPSGRTTAPDYLWETWMDTPHTPRDGFPVEIQMLWIACLRVFRPVFRDVDAMLEVEMERAEDAAWTALQRFYVRDIPADSLDDCGIARDLITPNPYFCFGIGLDLGPDVERSMRLLGRRQLAGSQGIRTLAPTDWERVFTAEFLGNRSNVRGRRMRSTGKFNYHRGVEWNWLSQFFVKAELKYGEADAALRRYLRPQIDAVLDSAGVGGISELFDLSGTRGPEFQAWSMAGFLEAMHAFAGVGIDVPASTITVEPQVPDSWPRLAVRKWFGRLPLDMRWERDGERRNITLEFPWGEPPNVGVQVRIPLPPRHTIAGLDVRLDGVPHANVWPLEPIVGTDRQRVVISVPAGKTVEITLDLARIAGRTAQPGRGLKRAG